MTEQQMAEHRMCWCRKWLARATQLADAEKEDLALRPDHVRHSTATKRLLLTEEILEDIGYEDLGVVGILRDGATLAGDVAPCPIFKQQFRPCLATLKQLEAGAPKRNQAILRMSTSCEDLELDALLLEETRLELERGWAEGPFELEQLEKGAVISRRFPLRQGGKVRLIDDYSVSGINECTSTHNKIDLHMIDTFAGLMREFFRRCEQLGLDSTVLAKTYDLKSAYRQVPIRADHLKFAYFSIYNHERNRPEIYRMKTLPFGATHSVYNFLRLARALHSIAARGLYLLNTNFYDDFILVSKERNTKSAEHGMEMVFLLTGWEFARDGKKSTVFDTTCKALGVEFNLQSSGERKLSIGNTVQRRDELVAQLDQIISTNKLSRHDALVLRGRLGFADSFVHGRLGRLVLSRLVEHAYGAQSELMPPLASALRFMRMRLNDAKPRVVGTAQHNQFFLYTDASYEPESHTGGLGAVLIDERGSCIAWFGIFMDSVMCSYFGAENKETIIYELELLAVVFSLSFWNKSVSEQLVICFGDNDAVRFALIKGSAQGDVANALMYMQLTLETAEPVNLWFARVPTHANISDFPSRFQSHPFLKDESCVSSRACNEFFPYVSKFQRCLESKGDWGR